jgi:hypothetical protein
MSFIKIIEIRPLIAGTNEYDERVLKLTSQSWIYKIFLMEGMEENSVFSAVIYPDRTLDITATGRTKTIALRKQKIDRL